MSSGTHVNVGEIGNMLRGPFAPGLVQEGGGPTDTLTERQQMLGHLWSFYRCMNYHERQTDWDGKQATGHLESSAIATAGFLPGGFYEANNSTLPLKFRKPTAPYYLAKVIVGRFNGLLFGAQHHPKVVVVDDPDTDAWLTAVIESTRLWSRMVLVRTYGGAMGTFCVGFVFHDGKPKIEVHDPRWCFPYFADREELILEKLEKRYQYPDMIRDPETGKMVEGWFWYRRVITKVDDTLWSRVPVEAGSEPRWDQYKSIVTTHNFGFCPVVWGQNNEVQDDIDGDPDCHGVFESIETIDALISQANRGILSNCFAAATPFVTDRGVRTFASFKDGELCTVLTHKGVWREATVRCFGIQPLFDVTMRRGPQGELVSVQATRDHRWLLSDGSDTDCLEVGDRLLAAPAVFDDFDLLEATSAERLAWCQGFAWGDGSRYARNGVRVRLCGKKIQYAPAFAAVGFMVNWPTGLGGDALASTPDHPKALPDIATTPVNLLRAFVRGYIDADGSKGHKASSRWRCIQATGEESIAFIRRALPAVGLYISSETPVTGDTNYGARTAETIRFGLNENRSDHPNSTWRVVAIRPSRDLPAPVWCLEVPEDHSFVLPFGVATRNCDPTLHIGTDDDVDDNLRKGSDNAIKTSSGGTVAYLEISGAGPKAALDFAEGLEKRVLRITRCVLDDNFAGPARTAAEVTQNYSNMIEQADILREQYGELGVKRLLDMLLRGARKLSTPVVDRGGEMPRVTRSVIKLPKTKEGTEHKIGVGEMIELDWPDWADPTLAEVTSAVDAAGKAMSYGLTDLEHGVRFIAHYFGVEDTAALVEKLEAATAAADPATAYDTAYEEPAAEEEIPVEEPVADPYAEQWPAEDAETLNGAQVKALVDVLSQVYAGTLPAVAAAEVILAAFPQVDKAAVTRMLSASPAVVPVTDTAPAPAKASTADEEPEAPAVAPEGVE